MTETVILVPLRDAAHGGSEWRDRLWEFCQGEWVKRHPTYRIFEGHHNEGPFNRAAAINTAAAAADAAVGRWDVALIIDADILADPAAVEAIVAKAAATNRMCVSHTRRVMLSHRMTERVLGGYTGSWEQPTQKVWTDSCSCCVAVSRALWDAVGGFDEGYVGWGFEDSAFGELAKVEGGPEHYENSTLFHLWHPPSKEAQPSNPLRLANQQRLNELRARTAAGARPRPTAAAAPVGDTTIPRIFHRTVPADTSAEVEGWWDKFVELHPGWEMRTYREPLDPAEFPLTSAMWPRCANGAQKAGLIRLELLVTHGGIYVDSDVEPFRPWDQLLGVEAFCGWEDEKVIPDAVLGARPGHPAFVAALDMALGIVGDGGDAWHSGPGVTTELLPNRTDVLVLPPGAFYPYHYLRLADRAKCSPTLTPGAFGAHHWHGSWLSPQQQQINKSRQAR